MYECLVFARAGLTEGAVIGIAVGVSLFILLLILGVMLFLYMRSRSKWPVTTREKHAGRFQDELSSNHSSFDNGYFHKRPDYLFWQSGGTARSIASHEHRPRYHDDRAERRSGRSGRTAGGGDVIVYEERLGRAGGARSRAGGYGGEARTVISEEYDPYSRRHRGGGDRYFSGGASEAASSERWVHVTQLYNTWNPVKSSTVRLFQAPTHLNYHLHSSCCFTVLMWFCRSYRSGGRYPGVERWYSGGRYDYHDQDRMRNIVSINTTYPRNSAVSRSPDYKSFPI